MATVSTSVTRITMEYSLEFPKIFFATDEPPSTDSDAELKFSTKDNADVALLTEVFAKILAYENSTDPNATVSLMIQDGTYIVKDPNFKPPVAPNPGTGGS